jgi:hypothetical protein
VGLVSVAPLISIYFVKSPYFVSSEFIGYRVGHAMMLQSGESDSVRPVQGIPTAFLSKLILIAGSSVGDHRGLSRADLDRYARTYGVIVALIAIALSVGAWVCLSIAEASVVSLFLAAPWYAGVASMALFLSPEYWLGEWIWLAATLFIIARRYSRGAPGREATPTQFLFLGAWAAVGVSIKVSLLGAAPMLFLSLIGRSNPGRMASGLVYFAVGLLLAYPLILVTYMGSFAQGFALLKFQFGFFQSPNHSSEYGGWRGALEHKPETSLYIAIAVALSCLALAVSAFRRQPIPRAAMNLLFMTAWLLLYLRMLAQRPHDTTLTSIGLSALFAVAFSVLLFPKGGRILAATLAAALLTVAAAITHFPGKNELSAIWNTKYEDIEVADRFADLADKCPYAIWYVPINEWNAAMAPELLGYNGGLGHYAVYYVSGHLSYNGKGAAFLRLWPNTYLIGADGADIINIKLAVKDGATVFYTKPDDSVNSWVPIEYTRLMNCLHEVGCGVVEVPVMLKGQHWVFGHSEFKK